MSPSEGPIPRAVISGSRYRQTDHARLLHFEKFLSFYHKKTLLSRFFRKTKNTHFMGIFCNFQYQRLALHPESNFSSGSPTPSGVTRLPHASQRKPFSNVL
jgi:hypothetical protein